MSLMLNPKKEEIKEFKVGEISSLIKRVIDDNFGFIRVIGEVSGLKVAASGHAYFNLKDNDAILACTCWKPIMSRLNFKLEDGMEIIATGRLTTYSGQSRYQLSVEKIDINGAGALMELLLKRKEALSKEGLFDQSRKKAIPLFPKKIGVITSPVGAVIQDILHRVRDRFPTKILLWPVSVQGENCASDVAKALIGFNKMEIQDRPDVIIVARGGGSIEDLWGFNEEIVVRAVADSNIPIISAIGHETDFTLIDFASDLRAPTPTAAAEFAVPVLADIKAKIKHFESSYISFFANYFSRLELNLQLVSRSFVSAQSFLFLKYQKLDDLSFRLKSSLPNNLKMKSTKLAHIKIPENAIMNLVKRKANEVITLFDKARLLIDSGVRNSSGKVDLYKRLLSSLSIKNILNRGFAVIRSEDGKVLCSKKESEGRVIKSIEWFDGKLEFGGRE